MDITAEHPTPSAATLVSPELADRAAELADVAERERRIPPELLRALRDAGLARMAVPACHGGADLPLPAIVATVEQVARADGALGWASGQIALSQIMVGHLPPATLDELYADGPDVLAAGAAAPKGRVTRDGVGWRVSGTWPLVSGAEYAQWIFLQCLAVDGGKLELDAGGGPRMRLVVLPSSAVEIIDTWFAVGLRGTGSHDVCARNATCADAWTAELAVADPGPAAAARIPPRTQGGLFVAACAIGIADGALASLTELVRGGKRPAFSRRRLADQPLFQARLGEAELVLAAARALLYGELDRADRLARDGTLAQLDCVRLRAAAPKAVELATRVTDTAFALGGATSVYERSDLQRRLRDAHAAAQHFTAGRDFYAALGALLLGEPADPALT
jgi:alkylation response protein AidB-like acyl-CoA dehydrogenase